MLVVGKTLLVVDVDTGEKSCTVGGTSVVIVDGKGDNGESWGSILEVIKCTIFIRAPCEDANCNIGIVGQHFFWYDHLD